MKTVNAKATGRAMLACIAILLATGTLFFSCKKNVTQSTETVAAKDDMQQVATMLDGEPQQGSIATAADDKGITMVFNKGSRYILIEKIPGMPGQNVDAIESAVLITSKYGVFIKDVTENKAWLLINNDEESMQKFEAIKQQLNCSYVSTTIYGVTVVKS